MDDRVSIPLEFAEFQSVFIVFPKSDGKAAQTGDAWLWQDTSVLKPIREVSGSWTVKFDPEWGGPESVEFTSLDDWSTHSDDRIKYYSGKAVYTTKFDLDQKPGETLFLDLGTVKNIAEVKLNGKNLGVVWTAPWQVDISEAVRKTDNELEIEVINLWPNRLIGDAALPPEQRLANTNIEFKKDAPLLSSGLLGPVTILAVQKNI
jgi:hypothetical protein